MHFPYSMALFGKTLAVSSAASDKEYDAGRMLTLDTDRIKEAIATRSAHPIAWDKVVTTNVLVPQEIGEISFTKNFISFASRDTNQLIALPVVQGNSGCNEPRLMADDCPGALSLKLSEFDPYALTSIFTEGKEESLLVSYESSDRIDVVKLGHNIALFKTFHAKDILLKKISSKSAQKQRLITRKIHVTFPNELNKSKVYMLLEAHPKSSSTTARAKASYLMSIKVADLLSKEVLPNMFEVVNLSESFGISGAQDFFIDGDKDSLFLLARVPELLFRIDLANKLLTGDATMCTGATGMAVSQKLDLIVIPCFTDNRIVSYSLSTLSINKVSAVLGRAPSYVVIDEKNDLIYCTYYDGGFLAIFDGKLNYLGHVFNEAAANRKGS